MRGGAPPAWSGLIAARHLGLVARAEGHLLFDSLTVALGAGVLLYASLLFRGRLGAGLLLVQGAIYAGYVAYLVPRL